MYVHKADVHNLRAPSAVVPSIIKLFHPTSVLDVGCGVGTWLSVFKEYGLADYFGIDGDYVDEELLRLYLDPEHFKAVDLESSFDLKRKFDLVISLEVAEHLGMDSAKV